MAKRLVVVAAACLTGCAPLALSQGARTVAKGQTVVGAGIAGWYSQAGLPPLGGPPGTFEETFVPVPAGFARYGLSDSADAGVTLGPGFVHADAKLCAKTDNAILGFDLGVGGGYIYEAPAGQNVTILHPSSVDGAGAEAGTTCGAARWEHGSPPESSSWCRSWGSTRPSPAPPTATSSWSPREWAWRPHSEGIARTRIFC